jgi:hypothetical protein
VKRIEENVKVEVEGVQMYSTGTNAVTQTENLEEE